MCWGWHGWWICQGWVEKIRFAIIVHIRRLLLLCRLFRGWVWLCGRVGTLLLWVVEIRFTVIIHIFCCIPTMLLLQWWLLRRDACVPWQPLLLCSVLHMELLLLQYQQLLLLLWCQLLLLLL